MAKLIIFLFLGLVLGMIDINTGGGFLFGGYIDYLIAKI